MTSSEPVRKVNIKCGDGVIITVDADLVVKMKTLGDMLANLPTPDSDTDEDDDTVAPIPTVNADEVTSPVMLKIIKYLEYHKTHPVAQYPPGSEEAKRLDSIDHWDSTFCEALELVELFDIVMAANYLFLEPLLDLGCKTFANMLKGKKVDDIRRTFKIVNDFTPEEFKQVNRENLWCSDPPNYS